MATTVYKVRGDTGPDLVMTLKGSDGAVQDLTGATVKFLMMQARTNAAKVNAAATVDTPVTAGVVRYAWQAADLDTVGQFEGEWQVTFAGGKRVTFPEAERFLVTVRKDVGD